MKNRNMYRGNCTCDFSRGQSLKQAYNDEFARPPRGRRRRQSRSTCSNKATDECWIEIKSSQQCIHSFSLGQKRVYNLNTRNPKKYSGRPHCRRKIMCKTSKARTPYKLQELLALRIVKLFSHHAPKQLAREVVRRGVLCRLTKIETRQKTHERQVQCKGAASERAGGTSNAHLP